ncbi:MAG: gamma-glutamylcyclotransferase [Desulfobacterales bacterium]|nr:gamma-glutamylcyclotransferase [Desulfobacterales bacterium]
MNLFTYGTLMFPLIFVAVTGRHFPAEKAWLYDYARYCVKGQSFPAIVKQSGAVTDGLVYQDMDRSAIEQIDRFEGALYQRLSVTVYLAEGSDLPARVYVIRPEHRGRLIRQPWSVGTFRRCHQQDFLNTYAGFSRTP